jgi:hypothetical protein
LFYGVNSRGSRGDLPNATQPHLVYGYGSDYDGDENERVKHSKSLRGRNRKFDLRAFLKFLVMITIAAGISIPITTYLVDDGSFLSD